jgi:hypothetical protein
MASSRWKRQEREIAAALGTRRLPNTGASQADVRCPGWALQIKTRKDLPAWLIEAVDQAQRDAGDDERAAVVLSHVSQGKKARRLVVLSFDDWQVLVQPMDDMCDGRAGSGT